MVVIEVSNLDLTFLGLILGAIGTYFGVVTWLDARPPDKLSLDLIDGTYGDVDIVNNLAAPARFFHIAVTNSHKHRIARNCYAFLLSLKATDSDEELITQTFELKWRGFPFHPNAAILPRRYRKFDVFWIFKAHPDIFLVSAFIDSNAIAPRATGTRTYRATVLVISDNFRSKSKVFELHLDANLSKVSINEA